MYFKPRIFISSTFSMLNIRAQIENFFKSVGAETMLYEKNLTPSIKPATYRQDIMEADFVIFILDQNYGTKTNTGKSGTHEEWEIALKTSIPKHVYIKLDSIKAKKDKELQKFIDDYITDEYISFYYYKTEQELMKRIKETTFTIAKEISLFKISQMKLDEQTIRKLAVNYDYHTALEYIRAMEELKHNQSLGMVDFIETSALSSLVSWWYHDRYVRQKIFIDNKINALFDQLLDKYKTYTDIHSNNFGAYSHRNILLKKSGWDLPVDRLKCETHGFDDRVLHEALKEFFVAYQEFKEYVIQLKSEFEIFY